MNDYWRGRFVAAKLRARKKSTEPDCDGEVVHGSLELDYEEVPIRGLKYYHENPRVGNLEKVAESLKANGQFKPIVVNRGTKTGRENEILAGNHTTKAARSLGWKKIKVAWVDVDEDHGRRIVLADNGSTDDATYNPELLAKLLDDQKQQVGHLIGTTYNDETLGKLLVEMNRDPLESIDSIEDAPDDLGGVDDLSRYVLFDSDLNYDIPELRLDMIPERLPEKLDMWGGVEIDGDRAKDENQWWVSQWHCVDVQTEALTARGWVSGEELREDDTILSMRPDGVLAWSGISSIFRKRYTGKMFHLTRRSNFDALVTPNHKFVVNGGHLKEVDFLTDGDVIDTFGESEESYAEKYTDDLVELVGWIVTEGTYVKRRPKAPKQDRRNKNGDLYPGEWMTPARDAYLHRGITTILIYQQHKRYCARIERCLRGLGVKYAKRPNTRAWQYEFSGELAREIREVIAPGKVMSHEFILGLSVRQRDILIRAMVDADGHIDSRGGATQYFTQKDKGMSDAFVMLCSLAGVQTNTIFRDFDTAYGRCKVYVTSLLGARSTAKVSSLDWHGARKDLRKHDRHEPTVPYDDYVWCPTTEHGNFVCRRNGKVYVTGNTGNRGIPFERSILSLYTEDFHFEGLYTDPSMNTKKIMNCGITTCIMPNYSVDQGYPSALWIWAAYRSAYVARYWQEAGLYVIPDIQYGGSDEALELCIECIPEGAPVVATQVQTIRGDRDRIRTTARLLKKAEEKIGFGQILVYGHTDADEVVKYAGLDAEVVRVETRTNRRRELLDSGTTVKGRQVRSKKRTRGFEDDGD
jgi:Domain of unknown function (DUF4417)/ParB-like nuclease domain